MCLIGGLEQVTGGGVAEPSQWTNHDTLVRALPLCVVCIPCNCETSLWCRWDYIQRHLKVS